MKKILLVLILLATLLQAQPGNPVVQFKTTDPSGVCAPQPLWFNYTLGKLWGCKAGTWTLLVNGGTGATIQSTLNVLKGDGAGNGISAGFLASEVVLNDAVNTASAAFTLNATAAAAGAVTVTTPTAGDNSNKSVNTEFIAVALQSINPAVSVQAATIAVLSNTPTYNNGTAGVGATLTAGSNGALTIDGYTVLLNDRVLVKNQASAFQNGAYTLTTLGTGGVPYVLTRATDYNSTTNINYTGTIPVLQGSTLSNTGWNLTTQVVAVGTTSLSYTQSATPSGPAGGNVKGTGNLANNTFILGAGGKTIQSVSSPNCPDTGGNHLNFNSTTGGITCGTSGGSTANQSIRTIGVNFDGGGVALTTAKVGYITVRFGCTLTGYTVWADTGTVSFDVWKVASGTAIPTVSNTIISGASYLALASGTLLISTSTSSLTTTTSIADDTYGFKIQAVASATQAGVSLRCTAN